MINDIHSDTSSRINWGCLGFVLLYIIVSLGVVYMVGCKATGSFQPWLFLTPDNLLGAFFLAMTILGVVGILFMFVVGALF